VRRIVAALDENADAVVPRAEGRLHPLAAAYRVSLLPRIEELILADRRRLTLLLEEIGTRVLDEQELREVDPELLSLRNVNTPEDYEQALALLARP
jgi:molybdopterin-guanine dinucleotide biosynthesis protein A